MDAKVGDWVVTPRQGRTVELNALWYNALRTAAVLASHLGNKTAAQELESLAKNVQASFNQRFWNPNVSGCFDIAENDQQDSSIRPNQLLAISLPYPVLSADRHVAVIELVLRELRTPMGVRSLSPRDPAYQAQYTGNVLSRDRAQHQGSVYPWLIGPLATAFLRAFGRAWIICRATALASFANYSTAANRTVRAEPRPRRFPWRKFSAAIRRTSWERPPSGRLRARFRPRPTRCRRWGMNPPRSARRIPDCGNPPAHADSLQSRRPPEFGTPARPSAIHARRK
jgi:hypothetical protein